MLPIVQRELQVASKRPLTHWSRFFAGSSMLIYAVIGTGLQINPQADFVFGVLASIAFAYALLAGPLHTADSLTFEKREGTLGLLFLTDLRGFDVVLGKLTASSLQAVYALLAIVPILALPLIFGGVTFGQFGRVVMALLVTVILSLTIGIFWSSVTRDFRTALTATLASLFFLSIVTAGTAILWHNWRSTTTLDWLLLPSPIGSFIFAFDEVRRSNQAQAGRAMEIGLPLQAGIAATALIAACVFLPRCWQDLTVRAAVTRPEGFRGSTHPLVGWRHVHWRHLMETQPYGWIVRVVRPLRGNLVMLLIPLLVVFAIAYGFALLGGKNQSGRAGFMLASVAAYLAHQLVKFQLAVASTSSLGSDRESGGLELLMVAGLERKDFLDGLRRGIGLQFRSALILLVTLNFLLLAAMVSRDFFSVTSRSTFGSFFGVVLLGGVVALGFDFSVIISIGARQALRASNAHQALRDTLFRSLAPGWLLVPLLLLFSTNGEPGAGAGLAFLVISMAIAGFFYNRATVDLQHGFKTLAAGLPFDTDDWAMRRSFQRSAMTDVRR
ncbi:MAG: hypothetical protein EXS36_13010 [Pedosphaera sp.]|nr:hypothetical protein [Pedosphaera sp.]